MSQEELEAVLQGCRRKHRESQYKLFGLFYGYAMSITSRYAASHEEAEEIANDAFIKMFTRLETYNAQSNFKPWFRKIIVNTAIDYFRARQNKPISHELDDSHDVGVTMNIIEIMTREEILNKIALLPPAYRTVFNLAVVDEYSHEEIAEMLHISVGASKSNLSRARQKLKEILQKDSYQTY